MAESTGRVQYLTGRGIDGARAAAGSGGRVFLKAHLERGASYDRSGLIEESLFINVS